MHPTSSPRSGSAASSLTELADTKPGIDRGKQMLSCDARVQEIAAKLLRNHPEVLISLQVATKEGLNTHSIVKGLPWLASAISGYIKETGYIKESSELLNQKEVVSLILREANAQQSPHIASHETPNLQLDIAPNAFEKQEDTSCMTPQGVLRSFPREAFAFAGSNEFFKEKFEHENIIWLHQDPIPTSLACRKYADHIRQNGCENIHWIDAGKSPEELLCNWKNIGIQYNPKWKRDIPANFPLAFEQMWGDNPYLIILTNVTIEHLTILTTFLGYVKKKGHCYLIVSKEQLKKNSFTIDHRSLFDNTDFNVHDIESLKQRFPDYISFSLAISWIKKHQLGVEEFLGQLPSSCSLQELLLHLEKVEPNLIHCLRKLSLLGRAPLRKDGLEDPALFGSDFDALYQIMLEYNITTLNQDTFSVHPDILDALQIEKEQKKELIKDLIHKLRAYLDSPFKDSKKEWIIQHTRAFFNKIEPGDLRLKEQAIPRETSDLTLSLVSLMLDIGHYYTQNGNPILAQEVSVEARDRFEIEFIRAQIPSSKKQKKQKTTETSDTDINFKDATNCIPKLFELHPEFPYLYINLQYQIGRSYFYHKSPDDKLGSLAVLKHAKALCESLKIINKEPTLLSILIERNGLLFHAIEDKEFEKAIEGYVGLLKREEKHFSFDFKSGERSPIVPIHDSAHRENCLKYLVHAQTECQRIEERDLNALSRCIDSLSPEKKISPLIILCKALIEKKRSADELEAFARFVTENGLGLKIIETPKNDLERMNNELYTLLSLDIAQHQQLDLIRVHICWYAKLQCYERLRESSKKYREQAVKYYPEGERAIYDAWIFEKAIGLISSKMGVTGTDFPASVLNSSKLSGSEVSSLTKQAIKPGCDKDERMSGGDTSVQEIAVKLQNYHPEVLVSLHKATEEGFNYSSIVRGLPWLETVISRYIKENGERLRQEEVVNLILKEVGAQQPREAEPKADFPREESAAATKVDDLKPMAFENSAVALKPTADSPSKGEKPTFDSEASSLLTTKKSHFIDERGLNYLNKLDAYIRAQAKKHAVPISSYDIEEGHLILKIGCMNEQFKQLIIALRQTTPECVSFTPKGDIRFNLTIDGIDALMTKLDDLMNKLTIPPSPTQISSSPKRTLKEEKGKEGITLHAGDDRTLFITQPLVDYLKRMGEWEELKKEMVETSNLNNGSNKFFSSAGYRLKLGKYKEAGTDATSFDPLPAGVGSDNDEEDEAQAVGENATAFNDSSTQILTDVPDSESWSDGSDHEDNYAECCKSFSNRTALLQKKRVALEQKSTFFDSFEMTRVFEKKLEKDFQIGVKNYKKEREQHAGISTSVRQMAEIFCNHMQSPLTTPLVGRQAIELKEYSMSYIEQKSQKMEDEVRPSEKVRLEKIDKEMEYLQERLNYLLLKKENLHKHRICANVETKKAFCQEQDELKADFAAIFSKIDPHQIKPILIELPFDHRDDVERLHFSHPFAFIYHTLKHESPPPFIYNKETGAITFSLAQFETNACSYLKKTRSLIREATLVCPIPDQIDPRTTNYRYFKFLPAPGEIDEILTLQQDIAKKKMVLTKLSKEKRNCQYSDDQIYTEKFDELNKEINRHSEEKKRLEKTLTNLLTMTRERECEFTVLASQRQSEGSFAHIRTQFSKIVNLTRLPNAQIASLFEASVNEEKADSRLA